MQEQEPISKSQRKRDMHALQAIGEKLTGLNNEQLSKIEMSDKLRFAITEMQRITKHEARRRQLQYIGRLMRDEESEGIIDAIAKIENAHLESAKDLHDLEIWRDRLINETKETLTEFIAEHPDADVQHLRHLIRNAQKEKETEKPAGGSRALFRFLRGC